VSLNSHTFATYLELVLALGTRLERFYDCQCEDDHIRFFYRTWVLCDGHSRWFKGSINLLLMEQKVVCFVYTIRQLIKFL